MNVVHSIDAYVLRSLIRRCSYDVSLVTLVRDEIADELLRRLLSGDDAATHSFTSMAQYYVSLYESTGMPDPIIFNALTSDDVKALSTKHLQDLQRITNQMLSHVPFDVITIHDDFKCHPNHVTQLRFHYNHILGDLADSQILDHILGELYNAPIKFNKLNPGLSLLIRDANYALC